MTRALGRCCEDLAAAYLAERGWKILRRNYRDGPREIDLIVRRGAVVAFVEVKARTSLRHGHPLEAIGFRKRRDLERAAKRWIRESRPGPVTFRFDALGLTQAAGRWRVFHVADAWRLGE